MKTFLNRTTLFLLLGFLLLMFNYSLNNYWLQNEKLSLQQKELTHLIIGDSHTQTALNPELLGSAYNLSESSESYEVIYLKLKDLFSDKDLQVENLIVSFGLHNVANVYDRYFWERIWQPREKIGRVFPYLDWKEIQQKDKRIKWKDYSAVFIRNMLLYPKPTHKLLGTGFEKRKYQLERANLEEVINKQFFAKEEALDFATKQMDYLDEIRKLCHINNTQLVVVATPVHHQYLATVPPPYKQYFEEQKKALHKKGVLVLDYNKYPLEDTYFYDYDHLNGEGADLFTPLVKQSIADFDESMSFQ